MNPHELFRFCACCPSPCRSAMPADAESQIQSETPSSLSLVALAVLEGELEFDAGTRNALLRTAGARACVAACPYGHDVASAITEFVEQRGEGLHPRDAGA